MGQLLRRGSKPPARHVCEPPKIADRGDIWACDCRRRWIAIERPPARYGHRSRVVIWVRRYWPWPRAPRHWSPPPGTGEWVDRLDPPPPWATGGPTD